MSNKETSVVEKCDNCDGDGYIPDGPGARRSCACGFAIAKQEALFKDVPLEVLVEYLNRRSAYKRQQG